jgi:23S rRNA pseudouridine1911/1915/1917 synthase
MSHEERLLVIPESHAGLRVDVALQQLLPEFSRSKLQEWIKDEFVFVNQSRVSSKHKVYAGDEIKIIVQQSPEHNAFLPEAIPLDIIFAIGQAHFLMHSCIISQILHISLVAVLCIA